MNVLDVGLAAVLEADTGAGGVATLVGVDQNNLKKIYQLDAPQKVTPPYVLWQEVHDLPGYAFGNTLKFDHAFYMLRAFAVDANTSGPSQVSVIADRLKTLLTNPSLSVSGGTVMSARFDRSYPPLKERDNASNRYVYSRGILCEVWVTPYSSLNNGLKTFYTMGSLSGSIAQDQTGNGNALSVTGSPIVTTGKIGNAISFNATHPDSLLSANPNVNLSPQGGSFMIWMWVKSGALGPQSNTLAQCWCFPPLSIDPAFEYSLFWEPSDRTVQLNVGGDEFGDGGTAVFSAPLSLGAWHLIVAWYDASISTLKISIDNGTPVTQPGATAPVFNTLNSQTRMGASKGASEAYTGLIDAAGFRRAVPTTAEIAELWNSGVGIEYPF